MLRVKKFLVSLKDKLLWGFFITAVVKGYQKLSYSFIFALAVVDSSSPSQSWPPTLFLALFSMTPLAICFFLLHNHARLEEKDFIVKYGALYANLKSDKPLAYCFNGLFLARRLLYALTLNTFATEICFFNVLVQILASLGLMLYMVTVRPFELRRDNWIEMMNEATIMAMFYMCLGVITNGALLTGELKAQIGFAMMGIIIVNIVINFSIFIYSMY